MNIVPSFKDFSTSFPRKRESSTWLFCVLLFCSFACFSQIKLSKSEIANDLLNRGLILSKQGKDYEAMAIYDEVIKKYQQNESSPSVRTIVAKAMFFKALTYPLIGKLDESLLVIDLLINRFSNDKDEAVLRWVHVAKGYKSGVTGK